MSDDSQAKGRARQKHMKEPPNTPHPPTACPPKKNIHKAPSAVPAGNRLLRAIVNSSAHGILVLDNEGNVTHFNSKFHELWNIPEETLRRAAGEEFFEYIADQLRDTTANIDDFKKLRACPDEYSDKLILKDNRIVHCRCTTLESGDTVLGRIATFKNITEQIRLENALRESEEKYRSFVKDLKGIAFKANLETWTPFFFHGSVEEITGYTAADFVKGNPRWDQVIHPDDLTGKIAESARKLREVPDFAAEREYRIVCKDGQVKWVHELSQNICDDSGKPAFCQGVIYDITDKRKLEEEIQRTSKLESVGMLAGGIAHDFNNLLTAIIGNLSLAKEKLHPDDEAMDNLKRAQKACSHAKKLTLQLLTFSKGGAPVRKTTRVGQLIRDSAVMAVRGSAVRCKFGISNDLWPVEVDDGQIKQAIHNLVLNARQAMWGGGTIEVIAENVSIEAQNLLPTQSEQCVRISISDNGVGIPAKNLDRIFDPYFTTKQNGSGLGLATTHSIVQQHGGRIIVESELGVGSTFHILLPAEDVELSEQPNEQEPARKQMRVLVMDDEELIRQVTGEMLQVAGYEPDFASDGETAIVSFEKAYRSNHPFDAVILDLTVPGGMGGKMVIQELLKIDPKVKAIVSSGYSNDPIMANYQEYGFAGCVTKPYEFEDLQKTLAALLTE